MSTTFIAASLFTLLAAGVVLFQLALALGAPWGAYSMGGSFPGTVPPAMRGVAILQALAIGLITAVVLTRAGVTLPVWKATSEWAIWTVVAFMGVGFVMNAISPSAGERAVWVPVIIVLLACSLFVALAKD